MHTLFRGAGDGHAMVSDGIEEESGGAEEQQQDINAPTEERQLHVNVGHVRLREETALPSKASRASAAAARAVEVLAAMPAMPPPKVARPLAGIPPTVATVVQSPMLAIVVQASPRAATAAQAVPSYNLGRDAALPPAVALPQRQWGNDAGTPAAPTLVNSAPAVQLQQGQGGTLLQAMAPTQAGVPGQGGAPAQGGVMVQALVPAMGMAQGQPWGVWPVMMQAGPGGYPGMAMQWMPTAAMVPTGCNAAMVPTAAMLRRVDDGGLPVRVVCRGCGLVRFDVEGRRWVHNHRQGKGNKQFACNRALCGCGQGDICPNRGRPHDPVAPGAVPAPGLLAWNPGQGASSQSSLPPLLSNAGIAEFLPRTAAPATTIALAGAPHRLAVASTVGAAASTVAALLMIGGSGEGSAPCSLTTRYGDGSGASDGGGRGEGDDGGTGSGQSTGSSAL